MRNADSALSLKYEDNGRGIAKQDHERVFDLFRRSGAQDRPGEGIGLAHVRTMVRNLGGDITLQSEIERGTTMNCFCRATCAQSSQHKREPPDVTNMPNRSSSS